MDVLGVDVGATKIEAVVFRRGRFRPVYHARTTLEALESLDEIVPSLTERYRCETVGVAVAGARLKAGRVYIAALKTTVRLPTMENVSYFKDSEAFAYASHHLEHPYTSSLAGVTIGTGVGLGIIVDGRPYHGAGNAGELGHTYAGAEGLRCRCGHTDHLEAYYSGWAFKGDAKAVNSRERMLVLARSLADLIHILDPEVIVLGGSIGKAVDIRRLRSMVYRLLLPGFKPRITKTRLRYAVAAGAALLAAYSPAPKPP